MREILFRGKYANSGKYTGGEYPNNGEWVYGDLVHYEDDAPSIHADLGMGWYGNYRVDPDTVGQYTGLIDKNGTRIFEDDIVSCVSATEVTLKGVVKFGFHQDVAVEDYNNYGWYIEWAVIAPCDGENDKPNIAEWIDDLSVIGNVHDNPDLTA